MSIQIGDHLALHPEWAPIVEEWDVLAGWSRIGAVEKLTGRLREMRGGGE